MVQNCKIQNNLKPTLVPIFQNRSGSILELRMHVQDLPTPYNVWDKLSSKYVESHSVVIAEIFFQHFTQKFTSNQFISLLHYHTVFHGKFPIFPNCESHA